MSEDFEFDLNAQVSVDSNTNEDGTLHLHNQAFSLPLKIAGFHSEKEFHVFVKNIERLVRTSIEYRLWVSYITESLGQNECVLSHEKMHECDIDVHHHPISLYTITKSVITKFMGDEIKFNTFDICNKVIELHYQNKVGFMVLLSDLHKKFHNGFQKLPIDYVNGDYRFLMDNYNIDEDERRKINEYTNMHINDCKVNWTREDMPGLRESA